MGAERKIIQNAFFMGNATTIQFLKAQFLLSRNFVVIAQAPHLLVSGSEKGVFWKRGLFRKSPFLDILENLEILTVAKKKGDSDHFLEILENPKILEILEISPAKRPLS